MQVWPTGASTLHRTVPSLHLATIAVPLLARTHHSSKPPLPWFDPWFDPQTTGQYKCVQRCMKKLYVNSTFLGLLLWQHFPLNTSPINWLTDHWHYYSFVCIQLALVIQALQNHLLLALYHFLLSLCCLRTKELISQSYSLVLMSYCITVQVTQSIHQLIHALIMCFYSNSLLLSLLTQITYSPSLVCVLPLLSVCALSANVSLAFVLFVSF